MFPGYIYFFKKVCMGVVRWFLSTLLLLKIIVCMKRCYVGVLGDRKMYKFCVFFFKCLKIKSECGYDRVCWLYYTLLKRHSGNPFENSLTFFQKHLYIRWLKKTESIYSDSKVLLVSFQHGMSTSIWQLCMTRFKLSSKERL